MLPKRIVFHVPSLRGGGAERVWVLMANELAARGHHVTLLTWNAEGPNAALRSDAVHLVEFGMTIHGESFGKPATLRGLWRMARFLRRHRPDAVYSAPEFANLVMALALTISASRAQFFPSYHAAAAIGSDTIGARVSVLLSGLVAHRATRAIAVSTGVGRDLEARGVRRAKIAVINNPLPPAIRTPKRSYPFEAQLAAMGEGAVIITAGRLVPVKDHKTLLAGFAKLIQRRPARLVIFGEGPLEPELRALASQLGIAERVLFAGYINDPAACYAVADLFVLTSLTEGFGNVLVEAMAAGVPVVSTDCPHGPAEILEGGTYGKLVAVGDVEGLATAMDRTLAEPTSPNLLKARAADFEVAKIGDSYERLLSGQAGS